jgi:predicted nucleic acid-binding protein
MILVDTSVWIDHLRDNDKGLIDLLNNCQVLMHPFILGELACGNLVYRDKFLGLLKDLPRSPVATEDEVLLFIDRQALMGQGIGYIDAHLLAAVALEGMTRLWTRDKRLHIAAERLSLVYAMD